ncbi:MAG: hypothetical protein GX491_18750 [Chloroflexi bacterium]|nr:hypothetical protein [Chloroflexota bacterium]
MGNQVLRSELFINHSKDLSDVNPNFVDFFICPICRNIFDVNDISSNKITDGHVWPEYIRQKSKSEIAVNQRVLLCKDCNDRAGSHGDKQMQLRERIKDAEARSEVFDERRIEIVKQPGFEPIRLRGKPAFKVADVMSGRITFNVDQKRKQWARNNPTEQKRFLALAADQSFTMIVYPHHELNSRLALAGWITSAYLFSFYSLGYRYIFQNEADIVRRFILSSFDDNLLKELQLPDSVTVGISETKNFYRNDPQIGLTIPIDGQYPVFLEVQFLDYQIRLPITFIPEVFEYLIYSTPGIIETLQNAENNKHDLFSPISCTKTVLHDCIWDYILGKPIPN